MKRIIYIAVFFAAAFMAVDEANAQRGKKFYVNLGWQFNGTVANKVAESAQGYGAYLETGYYLTPMIAIGSYSGFNSNLEYVGKQTYYFDDQSALTTDVTRSIYQVPMATAVRVRFMRHEFQPYAEAKIGAEYSKQNTYLSTFVSSTDNWGFYVSPEVGFAWYPFDKADFGFQFAVFYSYATNRNKHYDMNGINNLGFKLGIAF